MIQKKVNERAFLQDEEPIEQRELFRDSPGKHWTETLSTPTTTCNTDKPRTQKEKKPNLRVFPAFVVDLILKGTLLVIWVLVADIQDLGVVKDIMVEAQDLLVLAIHGRSHLCRRKGKVKGADLRLVDER